MLRYQVFAAYGFAFLAIWSMALQKRAQYALSNEVSLLIELAPLWVVIAIGIYLLTLLVHGVLNFKDCPEAAAELEQEIAVARVELKSRGII